MRIKSYYTQTIPEAMERARIELGADAMIIASNKTSGDTQRLGVYEVVFGIGDANQAEIAKERDRSPVYPIVAVRQSIPGLERLKDRLESLRKSISTKREQVVAAKANGPAKIAMALVQSGFPRALAEEIVGAVQARLREKKQDMMPAVRAELANRVRVSSRLGAIGHSRAIVALVGPSGAGKTTTIAKIAVKYGLATGRPARLVSTDTHRIGGTDLLRKYAGGMGVNLEAAANMNALELCLEGGDRNELLLIDTPAPRQGDSEKTAALASFLAKRADVEVHLVLPAYASLIDLDFMASRFKSFLPSRLIFTGTDQCSSGASMLAYSIESGLHVSFAGCGQEVPEDLEEASPERLMSRLLPGLMDAAASAA